MGPSLLCQPVSQTLDDPDKCNQDENGRKHQREVKGLIAVGQGDVSDAAASDVASHRSCSDEGDGAGCQSQDNRSKCFRKHKMNDNLERGRSHRLGCLDDAAADFQKRCLKKSC